MVEIKLLKLFLLSLCSMLVSIYLIFSTIVQNSADNQPNILSEYMKYKNVTK